MEDFIPGTCDICDEPTSVYWADQVEVEPHFCLPEHVKLHSKTFEKEFPPDILFAHWTCGKVMYRRCETHAPERDEKGQIKGREWRLPDDHWSTDSEEKQKRYQAFLQEKGLVKS